MSRRAAILGTAASLNVLFGCGGGGLERPPLSTAESITWGSRDTNHPAVGQLFTSAGSCTGTLIGPRRVLTAAHCAADGDKVQFLLENESPFSGTFREHPYAVDDPVLGFPLLDLAIVDLDRDARVTPMYVSNTPIEVGTRVAMVGYGLTETGTIGTRLIAFNKVSRVTELYYQVSVHPGTGGICFGDSGGPLLATVNGHQMVVGVTSWIAGSNGDCTVDYDAAWVRSEPHHSWITRGIARPIELSPGNGATDIPSSDGTVTLSWRAEPSATAYAVRAVDITDQRYNAAPLQFPGNDCGEEGLYLCTTSPTPSFRMPVIAGHQYVWWVHACSAVHGCSEHASATLLTQPLPAEGPTHLAPADFAEAPEDQGLVALTWDEVLGARSYAVRVVDLTDDSYNHQPLSLPENTCSGVDYYVCLDSPQQYFPLPVFVGHTYVWWVHTCSPDACSPSSVAYFVATKGVDVPIFPF